MRLLWKVLPREPIEISQASQLWPHGSDWILMGSYDVASSEAQELTHNQLIYFHPFPQSAILLLFSSFIFLGWVYSTPYQRSHEPWTQHGGVRHLQQNFLVILHYIELFFSVIEPQQNANIYISNSHFHIRACTTLYVWKIPYIVRMITP